MKVLKFGGSSLGAPKIIKEVKDIIETQEIGTVVVVSAFHEVTDQLVDMAHLARERDDQYKNILEDIKQRHLTLVDEVIAERIQKDNLTRQVTELFTELGEILSGIYLLKDLTPKGMDYVQSFGERLSATIMSEVVENGYFKDARSFIRTNDHFGKAKVDFEHTYKQIQVHLQERNHYIIVPGFIASTEDNETTTLGRGGSDYTAAIIAAAMSASVLEVWTDVDGFMTADPKMVNKAYAVESLTYAEAMELSHFGAKVIYTPTIRPVYQKNIPVLIKNTFNRQAKGTTITRNANRKISQAMIKGISSMDDIALMTLQGAGMVGVKGISKRLFGTLADNNINVILITQASSEYSISFAIDPADVSKAVRALEEEFYVEIKVREEIRLSYEKHLSIIAIVGEEMKSKPGISANLFNSLGRNGINVIAIAQGSSELNISAVVNKVDLKKAMNVIHEGFFLSFYKELHLFVIGIGNVGANLLQQIQSQHEQLMNDHKLKINLVGVANSKKMLIDEEGFSFDGYAAKLDQKGQELDHSSLVHQIRSLNLRNSVFVDCTANEDVSRLYGDVLDAYASVVTANKIACSSEYQLFEDLVGKARSKGVRFLYETNVGAGLPIIKTIDDLVHSGDKVLKLEAVLSGTLNFIFNELSADISLSKAVQLAKEKGFSEPDPRVDLSGIDVVRKILILSRQAGYKVEPDDVQVKTFLPDHCFEGSLDDFWNSLKDLDVKFEEERQVLEKDNKKWRFVAVLNQGKTSVELLTVDDSHPAYHLEGSNNIILITTERYMEAPMVIKGYGAGAEVTAAGVFADIIRIANI